MPASIDTTGERGGNGVAKKKAPASTPALLAPPDFAAEIAAGGERKRAASAWLTTVIDQAEAGDRQALKLAVEAHKAVPWLWSPVNQLQANVERSVLDAMLGADRQLFARATIERQMEVMRANLLGSSPSPLERLLVDRVVVSWLECQHADLGLAQRTTGNHTFALGDYHQRRAERAERRLLRATKALATVRRLLVPIVQVNVAEEIKQVNVVG